MEVPLKPELPAKRSRSASEWGRDTQASAQRIELFVDYSRNEITVAVKNATTAPMDPPL
jgi:hypothetical protein